MTFVAVAGWHQRRHRISRLLATDWHALCRFTTSGVYRSGHRARLAFSDILLLQRQMGHFSGLRKCNVTRVSKWTNHVIETTQRNAERVKGRRWQIGAGFSGLQAIN